MENTSLLTGGAEKRLMRERLTSSVYTSLKSIRDCVLGASANQSLICIVPIGYVDAPVETRQALKG